MTDENKFQKRRDQAYQFAEVGQFSQGIDLLEETLAEIDKLYPDGHLETVATCRDLAMIHMYARHVQEAVDIQQRGYDCCLKIYPRDEWPDGFIDPDIHDDIRSRTSPVRPSSR